MDSRRTIVCLMGPTASGKTQLAMELIKQFPFEIISVDSAMVYKGMDIGTAKPDAAILKNAPHRLIDFRDPKDAYSAAHFKNDAVIEIKDIFSRHKIPLLVGGTMLYFRALQSGLSEMPQADAETRKKIEAECEAQGLQALHDKLKKIDPLASARIHPNDPQRIFRALEVYYLSGKTISSFQETNKTDLLDYHFINIAIAPNDRTILHERIAKRFLEMLNAGLVDEVKKLFARGDLSLDTPAIRSVGYRQVWEYLLGDLTYEEMKERGIIATRQLAKRQLTWLRSLKDLTWFDSEDTQLVRKIILFLKEKS